MKFLLRFTPVTIEARDFQHANEIVDSGEYDQPSVNYMEQVEEKPAEAA